MLKILYAASNNRNARIVLSRFLKAMQGSKHQIKVAAYKKSIPKGLNVDWTLDCLLNIYKPELISLNNDNLYIYYDQVKNYNPDLIISDLEYFTSYIANELNATLWQCSSSIINYALSKDEKYNLGLFKTHAHALNRDPIHTQRTVNIIDNSNCNFVYSHYGDIQNPPKLADNFKWIRPYHKVGKESITCKHHIVAGLSNNDKDIMNVLKKHYDSVAFAEFEYEEFAGVKAKDIGITEEYFCNLKNCNIFVCQGRASFLADAFYNGKFSVIYPDYKDTESIINSHLSDNLNLGQIISYQIDINKFSALEVKPKYETNIKFLHEKINEL